MQPGARNLITDVAGIKVGNASDPALKSGVSVVMADAPMTASYAVMGGAPGTRDTDLLEPDKTVPAVDALVLSGGSAFGLDAASGVSACLAKEGRGYKVGSANVPIVPTAILFDLLNGGNKNWSSNPYAALGRAAFEARSDSFDLGTVGAGYGALCGMMKGGLGSASFELSSGITVGALVAANPVGNLVEPDGKQFWAAPFEVGAEFGGLGVPNPNGPVGLAQSKLGRLVDGANTTLAIVATDAILTKAEAKRLATVSHDGFARAIVPSHLPQDGDLIFAASTGRQSLPEGPLGFAELCHAASLCVARAAARGIYEATSEPGDTLPTWANFNR